MMEQNKPMDLQVQADEQTLQGKYSTMAQVTHTAEEFWIDFYAVLPNPQIARLLARIIVSPAHAKRLGQAILENVAKYESKFGAIEDARTPVPNIGFKQ
ncbi:MAG TPA: DUF3467 domain-containing protein [Acidobacteriota bacterium]|nr:DUF3467 domain-containing protein [Acidobacteriota bacterium]